MPYVDPFDVLTPPEGSDISLGNDRIRELKRALNERLDSFFNNWPDGQPLTAIGGPILLGMRQGEDIGSYGAQLLPVGALLYDLQEKKLYSRQELANDPMALELTALEEFSATFKIGLAAARPNPPDTDFYLASDTDVLSVRDSTVDPDVWVDVNPPAAAATALTRGKLGLDVNKGVSGGSVPTIIEWETAIYGQGTTVDILVDKTKLTVPAGAGGTYHITGVLSTDHIDTTHIVTIDVLKNGAVVWTGAPALENQRKMFTISTFDAAVPGDFYQLRVSIAGTVMTLYANVCFFEFVRLGA